MESQRIDIGGETVVVRHLATDDEAHACAHIMASSEPWITLRRDYAASLDAVRRLGYTIVGGLRDYVVAGHSEWLLRNSIGPLADWTTPRSPLAFDPRRAPR